MIKKAFLFYYNGFKNSTLAKKLLLIVLIKVFVMFIVLKLFFFKDFLNDKFDSDTQKGNYVIEQLTGKK
jgi:Na+/H+ antiporter NhaD/arsenite permease-like protein